MTGFPHKRLARQLPATLTAILVLSPTVVVAGLGDHGLPFETGASTGTIADGDAGTTDVAESNVPESSVPESSVPESSVPESSVPESSVPESRVPESSVPESSVPESSVPESSVPESTVPESTVSVESVPPEASTPREPPAPVLLAPTAGSPSSSSSSSSSSTTTTTTSTTTTTTTSATVATAAATARATEIAVVDEPVPNLAILAAGPVTVPRYPWHVSARPGNEVVNLSWNAPTSDGGSPVLAYRVQRSTNAVSWFTFAWIPATTRHLRVGGLENGITHYFRVVAVNEVGAGAPSWWASARPSGSAAGMPVHPNGLSLRTGSAVARLSWNAPAYDVGGPVLSYRVQRSINARDWTTFAWVPASTRTLRIGGLATGVRNYFRVIAVNVNGAGPPSWWASGVPSTNSPHVPTHPWSLATSVRSGTITVTWRPPAYGPAARTFRVQIAAHPDGGWWTFAWLPASARGATITGLSNGTRYYVRVVAVNGYGPGRPSWWAAATPRPVAAPPTTPPTDPTTPAGVFPTVDSAGVPDGWVPRRTIEGNYVVTQPGAIVQDLRINGSLFIEAPNVVVRRVEVVGGTIENFGTSECYGGLLIEDSSVVRGSFTATEDPPAIGSGGYTARNVLIDGVPEGFRVSGGDNCGPVVIERSYARVVPPDSCGDWHGDALQGYVGDALTIRDTVLVLEDADGCGGTAPFFYPDQGNTSVDIDGLIVIGGGYSFRLGTDGTVDNLYIVDGSWFYGPIDVACDLVSSWAAWIVRLQVGQPVAVRPQACDHLSLN